MPLPPSSPWIVRCSVQLYRWLLCLGPHPYRRQYADRTLHLFRECCLDAYRQRGIPGVLGLWLPLFSDVVVQMLAEHLSELQHASKLQVSVETVSPIASERTSSMNSIWQRINHQWIIPPLSAITLFRRKLTRPLRTLMSKVEQELWLKHPANMHFEQGLRHWVTVAPSGVVPSDLQGRSSAFLRVSTVPNAGIPHILPQKLVGMTLRQTIKADDYRGKQLRFSGEVKAEQVEQQGGLYIRTNVFHWKHIQEAFGGDQPGDPSIEANRLDEQVRPQHLVQGPHDWMRCEATVPVAQDALFIRFGLVLYGKGQIWLRDAQLEVIEQDGMLSASL
jgi:hypothetical protein